MNVYISKRSAFLYTLKAINKYYSAIGLQYFEFRMPVILLRRHRASQSNPDTIADMGGQFSGLSDVDLTTVELKQESPPLQLELTSPSSTEKPKAETNNLNHHTVFLFCII